MSGRQLPGRGEGPMDGDEGAPLPRDVRVASLLDEVAAVEDRLDPEPAKRGRRVADLLTVALIALFTLIADVQLRYPLLLVALLFAARGLSHLVPAMANRSLRRDRDRLLDAACGMEGSDEPGGAGR